MLTAENEGGHVKCHPYWQDKKYGPLALQPLSTKKISLDPYRIKAAQNRRTSGSYNFAQEASTPEGKQNHMIMRKFTLAHTGHPFEPVREITQLHYQSWPDFGAPANPDILLGIVEQCDAVVRSTQAHSQHQAAGHPDPPGQRPVLVHCSAGCGRTGTFCTVDSVIDMLKTQQLVGRTPGLDVGDWTRRQNMDLINLAATEFRSQRMSMVQSLSQYVSCYETVLEWMAIQLANQHISSPSPSQRV
jgi:tyrosine-protein phosphatase 2/3